jgi:hypothetical protein
MKPHIRKWVLEGVLCLAILGLLLGFWAAPMWWMQWKAAATLGLSESEARKALGQPSAVVSAAEVATLPPRSNWWGGESWQLAPSHPLTNKALIYYEHTTGVIIFVGLSGRVEHISTIGT